MKKVFDSFAKTTGIESSPYKRPTRNAKKKTRFVLVASCGAAITTRRKIKRTPET
jgi:hypothetical protein